MSLLPVSGLLVLDPSQAQYELQWEGRWVPVLQAQKDNTGKIVSALVYDKQSLDAPWGLFTVPDATGSLATFRIKESH